MSDTKSNKRLGKKLCSILRYGAIKEGLTVHAGGFVDIKELMNVKWMKEHSEHEVFEEIETSVSSRNTKRFERKDEHNKTFVRALFCRNFEQTQYDDSRNSNSNSMAEGWGAEESQ